ncbi:bifunctional aspartate kinase/homoserine dehydrogenase II [Moritella sp. F3]|uniref:bifunctional aspartate kinase/homoserine dehydrogenase II n=1 Tax=Moritella sp. F3 TaxID=2718882 RepID=UPI0018E1A630|nr:bifunctional aspartate kinase/homoserine dehydrogenase II [Moritella sp. F3]GIC79089.1 bifunctional aspartate kinase/homoserine dehydrogenase II [Moritella sp. F1]GIC84027.1 bifunctional aspartate kinase/homoserine dehydrogenase II [Moritella sp. F3]
MDAVKRSIHKFGGSSLADATCYRRVSAIISEHTQAQDLIVVSAAGKTTNQLLELLQLAEDGDQAAPERLIATCEYQAKLIAELLIDELCAELTAALQDDIHTISHLLETNLDVYAKNQILAHGEVWSARLLAALLTQNQLPADDLDSRLFFTTELAAQPVVDEIVSRQKLAACLVTLNNRVVVTGFIAGDSQQRTVTLGRNGSDYSATLLSALVDASQTTIWSDVAGVFSADPRRVKDAELQTKLSLDEAAELARLGSPVLHARTLQPVMASKQHVQLRCSYTPSEGSTQIHRRLPKGKGAKIVTSIDDLYLVDIEFSQSADYQAQYNQLIALLALQQLSPICIKRRPTEHVVRLGYTAEIVEFALSALLAYQQAQPQISAIDSRSGFCMVALVGSGVTENALQSHQFYQLISEHNLSFVQTGDNHLSICAVLQKVVLEPLLKELHTVLFKQPKRVGVVLFGKGNIGAGWLSLFAQQMHKVPEQQNVELYLCGVYGSQGGVLDFNGLDAATILDNFQPETFVWEQLLSNLALHPFDELVVIDITASEAISYYYPEFAQHGFHLISANKFAGAASSEFYNRVKQSFSDNESHWLYNATVGAGLPIQSSMDMLQHSGDQVTAVSGIFSGTLSWLFQQYNGEIAFSQLVEQAWQQGLTEPDPREDLSGKDVQRKLLILSREAGYDMELSDIKLESLVTAELMDFKVDEFLEHCEELDDKILRMFNKAKKQGLVLRYVASFSNKDVAQVGLEFLEPTHPFANLLPCDNIFSINSHWYRHNPLVIQGPGAGKEVTAGAIQADLFQLCKLFAR